MARTGYPTCETPLKMSQGQFRHLLPSLPAAHIFCRAATSWPPGTPNMTGLQILCPQVNSPSYLAGSCSGSTKITLRPFPCLLQSFASEACSAAALDISLRSLQALWRCPGLLEKTIRGPCGLNKDKISAAHICSAKPPSISSGESQPGQPKNDVLLLAYCCCYLGFSTPLERSRQN